MKKKHNYVRFKLNSTKVKCKEKKNLWIILNIILKEKKNKMWKTLI